MKTDKKESHSHRIGPELENFKATFNTKTYSLDTKWEKLNTKDVEKNDCKTPSKTNSHRKPNRRKKRASTERENSKAPVNDRAKEKANSSSSEASSDVLEEAASKEGLKSHTHTKSRHVAKKLDSQSSDCSEDLDLELPKTRKYLWFSKNTKNHLSKGICQLSKVAQDKTKTFKSSKVKKIPCSPHKKLSRSSLTIDADITINLSKYSPCASRLAASSKILSTESVSNSESPLHLAHSRSPSHVGVQPTNSLPLDTMSIQASLSLNIQNFEKTRSASRSRSVGDSCVTSPTSEGTTLSYSPTVTEILSLEEVIPQILVTEDSPSYLDVKGKSENNLSEKPRKSTLETKC